MATVPAADAPPEVPAAVLHAYGWQRGFAHSLGGGLINLTYLVETADHDIFGVLQRLHPVFSPAIHENIFAVTQHLLRHGHTSPRLLPTNTGALYTQHEGAVWRALSFIPGHTVEKVTSTEAAWAAGHALGRFHLALRDLQHTFLSPRAGVHDLAHHLAKLKRLAQLSSQTVSPEVQALANQLCQSAADQLRQPLPTDSVIGHGDPKIANLLFSTTHPLEAVCWIDLDTVGPVIWAHELGDALRSWCNQTTEDMPAQWRQDFAEAALSGVADGRKEALSAQEQRIAVQATALIATNLAVRFCNDVFEDNYFGWDATRFASRADHNLARATGQADLAKQVTDFLR